MSRVDIPLPLPKDTPGWCSKVGWRGKAHFVMVSGETACAQVSGPGGVPMGELFRCGWGPLDEEDHLCGHCRRALAPRVLVQCMCGACRVRPVESKEDR